MKKVGIFVLVIAMFMAGDAFTTTISDIMPLLKKAKADVSATFNSINKDLASAAEKLAVIDHKSAEARQILSKVCEGRPYVYDCAIIDMNGKLSVMEPEGSRKYEGKDIGWEPQVKELFKTKAPIMSNVFHALDKTGRVDFEYPITTGKGELIGAVSLLVKHDALLEEMITPLVKNKPCKIWVMQTDGLILYDQDPDQINKNIFTDPMFEPFSDLISFSRTVAYNPSGAGSYDFYKKGYQDKVVVKKDAVWDTVKLYGNEWRIVVMEIEEGSAG